MAFLNFTLIGVTLALLVVGVLVLTALFLRRVVPTNTVHIVQSKKLTTSFGAGQANGNTYYAWPSWIPFIGVQVLTFPMSIFKVDLSNYEAYDTGRLPFLLDATAFFRIGDSNMAAQRAASFEDLKHQLLDVVRGAVRHVLASDRLENILGARSELAATFTEAVNMQIVEWGVTTVKTIEFMDIRDSGDSKVIHNLMEKEKSRIDKESRMTVAENRQAAQTKEIEAQRQVDLSQQEAEQQVGMRTAEKEKAVGISREQSKQEVAAQAATTADRTMAVRRVEETLAAEIAKDVAITNAEAKRQQQVIAAEAALIETQRRSEGIQAEGAAKGAAETAILMAPVDAQVKLAKEVGTNEGYQTYLIKLEGVRAGQVVGVATAEAIKAAKIQIISNGSTSQGQIMDSVAGIGDMFSTKGGTGLTGMIAALTQLPEGKALLTRLAGTAAVATTAVAAAKSDEEQPAARPANTEPDPAVTSRRDRRGNNNPHRSDGH